MGSHIELVFKAGRQKKREKLPMMAIPSFKKVKSFLETLSASFYLRVVSLSSRGERE